MNGLWRFVVEARRTDGKVYLCTTLLTGLLRCARSKCADFLDKSDAHFSELHVITLPVNCGRTV